MNKYQQKQNSEYTMADEQQHMMDCNNNGQRNIKSNQHWISYYQKTLNCVVLKFMKE